MGSASVVRTRTADDLYMVVVRMELRSNMAG